MDLVMIAITAAGLVFVAWFGRRVGEDAASRRYQATLAAERAKSRRLTRDLEDAREEAAMHRRNRGGVA